uniref:Nonstructural protein n=1 Tax=Tarsiger cyanurus densovirus TaxID=2794546 RepID=A0A8A4XE26_9VIRU|nr:MAG: nonstructural protein [Tarsiger cyanurus densovirus]
MEQMPAVLDPFSASREDVDGYSTALDPRPIRKPRLCKRLTHLSKIMDLIQRTESRSCSELYDKCTFSDWQEIVLFGPGYHELVKSGLELYIKKQLDTQRAGMWNFAISNALKTSIDLEQFLEFKRILVSNDIHPHEFAQNVREILNKTHFKKNSIRLIGAPNSCKTLLANMICAPFICCHLNNHGSENEFFASNMLNKAIIHCEELYLTTATAEDFKSFLGGQDIDVAKKFQEKQLLLRTPCIITSNHNTFGRGHLPAVDENALNLRCFTYHFSNAVMPKVTLDWRQFYLFLNDHVPT